MGSRRIWSIIVAVTLGTSAALGVGGWWAITRVLPGPWHARHSSQVAADRVAPGTVEVTSATWDFELGGFIIDGHLRGAPEATVRWRTASSTACDAADPGCRETILSAIETTRTRVQETHTLTDALNSNGCPVTRVSNLSRSDGEVRADIVVALPRDQVPVVASHLDTCMQAWARARPASDGPASVRALLYLAEPGTGNIHSTARAGSDATGHITISTAGSLGPSSTFSFEDQNAIDDVVDTSVVQWLSTQGNPQIREPHVNPGFTRYAPGRADRVVMYAPGIPRSSPDGAFLGEGAVAVTVDLDGTHADNFRIVPSDDNGPADPELPR